MFMRHPETSTEDGPFAETSEEAFTSVYEPKGWVRVDDAVAAPAGAQEGISFDLPTETAAVGPVEVSGEVFTESDLDAFDVTAATPDSATKPFLIAVAKRHGVSTGGSKEAILGRLREKVGAQEPDENQAIAAGAIDPDTGESLRDQTTDDAVTA